jgi:hypothetical protein
VPVPPPRRIESKGAHAVIVKDLRNHSTIRLQTRQVVDDSKEGQWDEASDNPKMMAKSVAIKRQ